MSGMPLLVLFWLPMVRRRRATWRIRRAVDDACAACDVEQAALAVLGRRVGDVLDMMPAVHPERLTSWRHGVASSAGVGSASSCST